jgi:TRAP transporter TAXI family solute receptor
MMTTVVKRVGCSVALLSLWLAVSPGLVSPQTKEWPKSIIIWGGAIGSGMNATGTGMVTIINKYLHVKGVAEAGGLSKGIYSLRDKSVEFSFSGSDQAYYASRGLEEYKPHGKTNIAMMFSCAVTPSAFVVRADSAFKKLSDLKNKKIMLSSQINLSIGRIGEFILGAEGMTKKDFKADFPMGMTKDAAYALIENRIDVFHCMFTPRGKPSWAEEINLQVPLRIFSAEEKNLEAALKEHPFYRKGTLSAGDYRNMVGNKDLISAALPHQFLCRPDLPEDFVYEVTKTILEHVAEISSFHPDALSHLENPLALAVVPFHSGAIKYYKEKKLWTPALEDKQQKLLKEMSAAR